MRIYVVIPVIGFIETVASKQKVSNQNMRNMQNKVGVLLGGVAFVCILGLCEAKAAQTYGNVGDFVSSLASYGTNADGSANYYLNTFNDLNGTGAGMISYSSTPEGSATLSYNITAPSHGLYFIAPGGNPAPQSYNANDPLIVTFTSGNVNAVAGNFWQTTGNGTTVGGTLTLDLSDGTEVILPSSSFLGFTTYLSGVYITSLEVTSDGSHYATVDNLIVADAPEPATLVLAGLGAAALLLFRRK